LPSKSQKEATGFAKGDTVATNSFRPRKYEDHSIVDDSKRVVGHIRVKPSGMLWSPKGGHDWYGVSLAAFADFMEANGKKQKM
jgi:hypothetical protein